MDIWGRGVKKDYIPMIINGPTSNKDITKKLGLVLSYIRRVSVRISLIYKIANPNSYGLGSNSFNFDGVFRTKPNCLRERTREEKVVAIFQLLITEGA